MKVKVKDLIKAVPQQELSNLGIKWTLEDTVVAESTIDADTDNLGLFIYIEDEDGKQET